MDQKSCAISSVFDSALTGVSELRIGNGVSSVAQSVSSAELASESQTSSVNRESWSEALTKIQGSFDPQIYTAYIKPLRISSYNEENGELIIAAPSKFLCNHVQKNLAEKILVALSDSAGVEKLSLKFSVETPIDSAPAKPYVVVKRLPEPAGPTNSALNAGSASGLNPRYTFENFVVGKSNEFSHAAALRVAEQPGQSYNPLFIYGGVGLGKTHLLHAIGNAVLARDPSARVFYLSSETFTNELIQALRHDKMEEFKKKIRNINVLLVDDIQFMAGKERTQEEFFHTFNALYNGKRQIVMTSDKVPGDIPGLEERLHTRFSWGLTADLQCPDFETRVAILKRKAAFEAVSLPEDVAHLISHRISSNVRELEGALIRLHAVSSLRKTAIDLELAQSALRPLLQARRVSISIDDIKKAVALQFSVKVSDLVSKRRTKAVAFPRHVAMYLCRKHTSTSYPEIGAHFGGRDHSSVIHAANVISLKVASEHEVKETITQIEKALLGT